MTKNQKNKPKMLITVLLAVFLILLAFTGTAAAKEWTVGNENADFKTIPEAVTAAADGDVIKIQAGTYAASANISVGKSLRLKARILNPLF